jgi:hypothetical protein
MGAPHIVKKCGDCGQIKPVDEFYRAGKKRDGYCKECRRHRDRARAAQKECRSYTPDQRRDYKYRQMYGISLSEYEAMVADQNGACAICGGVEKRRVYGEAARLVVDHNHVTGKVRGLLCCACNGRLASIEDEQFMLLAKNYLSARDGYEFVPDIAAAQEVQAWIRGRMEGPT